MKTRTKALLLVLCAALLVAVTALTTIAWLTHTPESVVNTFTFTDSDKVTITLDEAKVDAYGNPLKKSAEQNPDGSYNYVSATTSEAERVYANTYKLLPGHSYVKDPTIHVADDSIDCFLFVTVDNAIAGIEDETTIADQMTVKGWVKVEGYTNVYALMETVKDGDTTKTQLVKKSAGQDAVVFESFKIKGTETATSLAAYNNQTVTVKAYAVQAEGFEGKTAKEAWKIAFPGQGTAETPEPETTPNPAE